MEVFINNTITIWASDGVVHLEAVGYLPEEKAISIEWNANELLDDLPSLYQFCKIAIDQQDITRKKRFKEFSKTLAKEYK